MRVRADQELAKNVLKVTLDGKVVPLPYEADDVEGWVTSYIPVLPEQMANNGENILTDEEQATGFKLVRRAGSVKIVFKQGLPTMGNQ